MRAKTQGSSVMRTFFFIEDGGGGAGGSRFFNLNPPCKNMKNESISKKISSQGESFFLQKPDAKKT